MILSPTGKLPEGANCRWQSSLILTCLSHDLTIKVVSSRAEDCVKLNVCSTLNVPHKFE